MNRQPLPARRASETIKLHLSGHTYFATVGYYDMAMTRPGEVFLSTGKEGTALQVFMRDSAIAASLALQHGVPMEMIHRAFSRNDLGEHESPLGVLFDLLIARPS